MKAIVLLAGAWLIVLFLSSFIRKNKGVTGEAKRLAILTTGKWQLADNYAEFIVNGKSVKHSKWHQLDTCFKDNLMIFGSNGKLYYDQGKLKCHAISRRIDSSFTWRLDDKEDLLWAESEVYTQPLYIEYLSDSILEVNEYHFFGDSSLIKVYKHILPGK